VCEAKSGEINLWDRFNAIEALKTLA